MPDDEMPFLPDRDDPLSTKVEFLPPTTMRQVLVNGLRLPHITTSEGTDTLTIVVDERIAYDLPIEHGETVLDLVANVIAVERGYGSWPAVPDNHDQPKAPAFGPIHHEVSSVSDLDTPESNP